MSAERALRLRDARNAPLVHLPSPTIGNANVIAIVVIIAVVVNVGNVKRDFNFVHSLC